MTDEQIKNEYKVVSEFEEKVSKFCGSKYAVAVDCCTNALFLSLVYQSYYKTIKIPRKTYIGVYSAIKNSGKNVEFEDIYWDKMYSLKPTNIYDSACVFEEGMYKPGTVMCVSFSYKKRLPIGRGGIILTDKEEFRDWCILARNLNKDVNKNLMEQKYSFIGYNMLFHPDLAKKGLELWDSMGPSKYTTSENYPDLVEQIS